ncbi:unnamed protein product [Amoebophrya sp. A25]|nr:unnamed protein product [Amoebophrya sp. A25]|eukprot:GSA25T00014475001.1
MSSIRPFGPPVGRSRTAALYAATTFYSSISPVFGMHLSNEHAAAVAEKVLDARKNKDSILILPIATTSPTEHNNDNLEVDHNNVSAADIEFHLLQAGGSGGPLLTLLESGEASETEAEAKDHAATESKQESESEVETDRELLNVASDGDKFETSDELRGPLRSGHENLEEASQSWVNSQLPPNVDKAKLYSPSRNKRHGGKHGKKHAGGRKNGGGHESHRGHEGEHDHHAIGHHLQKKDELGNKKRHPFHDHLERRKYGNDGEEHSEHTRKNKFASALASAKGKLSTSEEQVRRNRLSNIIDQEREHFMHEVENLRSRGFSRHLHAHDVHKVAQRHSSSSEQGEKPSSAIAELEKRSPKAVATLRRLGAMVGADPGVLASQLDDKKVEAEQEDHGHENSNSVSMHTSEDDPLHLEDTSSSTEEEDDLVHEEAEANPNAESSSHKLRQMHRQLARAFTEEGSDSVQAHLKPILKHFERAIEHAAHRAGPKAKEEYMTYYNDYASSSRRGNKNDLASSSSINMLEKEATSSEASDVEEEKDVEDDENDKDLLLAHEDELHESFDKNKQNDDEKLDDEVELLSAEDDADDHEDAVVDDDQEDHNLSLLETGRALSYPRSGGGRSFNGYYNDMEEMSLEGMDDQDIEMDQDHDIDMATEQVTSSSNNLIFDELQQGGEQDNYDRVESSEEPDNSYASDDQLLQLQQPPQMKPVFAHQQPGQMIHPSSRQHFHQGQNSQQHPHPESVEQELNPQQIHGAGRAAPRGPRHAAQHQGMQQGRPLNSKKSSQVVSFRNQGGVNPAIASFPIKSTAALLRNPKHRAAVTRTLQRLPTKVRSDLQKAVHDYRLTLARKKAAMVPRSRRQMKVSPRTTGRKGVADEESSPGLMYKRSAQGQKGSMQGQNLEGGEKEQSRRFLRRGRSMRRAGGRGTLGGRGRRMVNRQGGASRLRRTMRRGGGSRMIRRGQQRQGMMTRRGQQRGMQRGQRMRRGQLQGRGRMMGRGGRRSAGKHMIRHTGSRVMPPRGSSPRGAAFPASSRHFASNNRMAPFGRRAPPRFPGRGSAGRRIAGASMVEQDSSTHVEATAAANAGGSSEEQVDPQSSSNTMSLVETSEATSYPRDHPSHRHHRRHRVRVYKARAQPESSQPQPVRKTTSPDESKGKNKEISINVKIKGNSSTSNALSTTSDMLKKQGLSSNAAKSAAVALKQQVEGENKELNPRLDRNMNKMNEKKEGQEHDEEYVVRKMKNQRHPSEHHRHQSSSTHDSMPTDESNKPTSHGSASSRGQKMSSSSSRYNQEDRDSLKRYADQYLETQVREHAIEKEAKDEQQKEQQEQQRGSSSSSSYDPRAWMLKHLYDPSPSESALSYHRNLPYPHEHEHDDRHDDDHDRDDEDRDDEDEADVSYSRSSRRMKRRRNTRRSEYLNRKRASSDDDKRGDDNVFWDSSTTSVHRSGSLSRKQL